MTPQGIERVREQLKIDEGVEYEIYLDHLDLPTVGIGHLIIEGDYEHGKDVGTPVSVERVNELFDKDLDIMLKECAGLYDSWDTFPEEVQEVLVNMCFNVGATRLRKFKNMTAALEEGDWKKAAVEGRDSLWYRQVTNRAERLMGRLESV